jgi:branched-chain amino acid transport system substrate-binding protein
MITKAGWIRRRLVRTLAGAGLALAAALAGVVGADAAEGPIRIGVAGPMTGTYRTFGAQLRAGGSLAVERLNAAGGVLGRHLALTVLDDRCEPALAVQAAERAARQGLRFVAGHFCSGSSIPAAQVYRDRGIVMITPASTNPALTEQGNPLVFRVIGRDDAQARFAADHVLDRLAARRVAVLDDDSAYGDGLADTFAARLRSRDVQPVARLTLTAGPEAVVDRLRAARAKVLYYGGYAEGAAAVLRGARSASLSLRFIGADALADQGFWDAADGAAQGTLFTFAADPRGHPAAREVVAAFRARGIEPEGYVLLAYAAVQVWAEGAGRAGTPDAAAVAATLHAGAWPTVQGRLAFDRKGDLRRFPFVMYRWQNGRYRPAPG